MGFAFAQGAVSLWLDPSSAIHQHSPVLERTVTHQPISGTRGWLFRLLLQFLLAVVNL